MKGWRIPLREGFPLHPYRRGYHWIRLSGGGLHAAEWNGVEWNLGRDYLRPCEAFHAWEYVGPCLTPTEVTAKIEACAAFIENFDYAEENFCLYEVPKVIARDMRMAKALRAANV